MFRNISPLVLAFLKVFVVVFLIVTLYFFADLTSVFRGELLQDYGADVMTGGERGAATKPVSDEKKVIIQGCAEPLYLSEIAKKAKISDIAKKAKISDFKVARESYHDYINCIFNNATKRLEDAANKQFKSVGCSTKGKYAKILESTRIIGVDDDGEFFGMADVIINEYKRYMHYLDLLEVTSGGCDYHTLSALNQCFLLRAKEVEEERDFSKQAFDVALQVYDEMRIAYPLHKQLNCLAKSLQSEMRQLAGLRVQVQCMPSKFINAATSSY